MPTPRHVAEVAKRAARTSPATSKSGAWIPGVVLSAVSDTTLVYEVYLGSGASVEASSVIDAPIAVQTLVWVVRDTGGKYLIVAAQ